MNKKKIRAPVGSEKKPDYFSISDEEFEDFCEALFSLEEHLVDVNRVDPAGRPQFGADIRANRRDGRGEEVVSCKREQGVTRQKLIDWSDDFLKHWKKVWRPRSVQRFVLATAAAPKAGPAFDQLKVERARFRKIGVKYEVWGPAKLTELARGKPAVLSQFYEADWEARLLSGARPTHAAEVRQLTAHADAVTESLIAAVRGRIDAALRGHRSGNWLGLDRVLDEVFDDSATWRLLPDVDKARLWRLRADQYGLRNQLDDLTRALDEADKYDGGVDGSIARAQLAVRTGRPSEALEILSAPASARERRIRASAHLTLGHPQAALDELSAAPGAPDIDLERLKALALLDLGRTGDALNAVLEASRLEPDNFRLRETEMHVRYVLSHAPITPANAIVLLEPLPQILLREDEEAIKHLERVEALARELAVLPVGLQQQRELAMWQLASLGDRPDKQDAARELANSLLCESRPIGLVVIWALTRGWDFDLPAVEGRLREALASPTREADQLFGLAATLVEMGRHQDALLALEEFAAAFSNPDERVQVDHWRNRITEVVHVKTGSPDAPDAGERETPTATWSGEIAAIPTPTTLTSWIHACKALFVRRQWDLLKPAVPVLLGNFASPEAVYMALFVIYETAGGAAALEACDRHKGCFFRAELPGPIRRLRVAALKRLGRLLEAQSEALQLALEVGQPTDRLNAITVSHHLGDEATLLQIARDLAPDALDARTSLRVAEALAQLDRDLARKFWSQAHKLGIPEEALPAATVLAITLEVGAPTRAVMREFERYAAQDTSGVVKVATIDDLTTYFKERKQAGEQAHNKWRAGVLPIHLLVQDAPSLVSTWSNLFGSRRERPQAWFIHAGGRTDAPATLPKAVLLDTTALLTAWHLGILNQVETAFGPLVLAPSVPEVLREAVKGLRPRQANLVRGLENVLLAADQQRIQATGADLPEALRVSFHGKAGERPEANLRWVAEALSIRAGFDEPTKREFLERLGTHGEDKPVGPEAPPDTLFFDAHALRTVAEGPEFASLLDSFSVVLSADELAVCRNEQVTQRLVATQLAEISRLQAWVLAGLHDGRYKLLERTLHPDAEDSVEDAPFLLQPALELLRYRAPADAWLWIDDRFFHSLQGCTVPIVNSVDIVDALVKNGSVDTTSALRHRKRLRECGAAFVPITVEEVLAAIAQRNIKGLQPIIWSHNQAALDAELLRLSQTQPPEPWSEGAFSLDCMTLWPRVVASLWRDEALDLSTARQRAHVALAFFARPWWSADEFRCPSAAVEATLTMQLSLAVVEPLTWTAPSLETRRRAYLNWLDESLITPLVELNPWVKERLADRVASALEVFLSSPFEDKSEGLERAVNALVAHWLVGLPEFLKDRILALRPIAQRLPISQTRIATVGTDRFDAHKFAAAAALAFAEGTSEIRPNGSEVPVVLKAARDGPDSPVIVLGDGSILGDPSIVCASPLPADRLAMLGKHPEYWRATYDSVEQAHDALRGMADPLARMDALERMREGSPAYRYHTLRSTEPGIRITYSELRPISVAAQLRYLGIDDDTGDWPSLFESACARLLQSFGAVETLRRFASLPVGLPDNLEKALWEQPVTEQLQALRELCTSNSPVHRVHGIRLALSGKAPASAAIPSLVDLWLADGPKLLAPMLELLKCSCAEFCGFEFRDPTHLRISAWSHSGALLHSLLNPLSPEGLERIGDLSQGAVVRAHLLKRIPRGDVLDLDSLTPTSLLAALSNALFEGASLAPENPAGVGTMRELLALKSETGDFPSAHLLPRIHCSNYTHSWLGNLLTDLAIGLDWPALAAYGLELAAHLHVQAIKGVEAAPANEGAWNYLLNISPPGCWDSDSLKAIARVLTDVNPTELRNNCNPTLWTAIVTLLVACAEQEPNDEVSRRYWDASYQPRPDADLAWANALFLACASDTLRAASARLASELLRWIEIDQNARSTVFETVRKLERFLPVHDVQPLRAIRLATSG